MKSDETRWSTSRVRFAVLIVFLSFCLLMTTSSLFASIKISSLIIKLDFSCFLTSMTSRSIILLHFLFEKSSIECCIKVAHSLFALIKTRMLVIAQSSSSSFLFIISWMINSNSMISKSLSRMSEIVWTHITLLSTRRLTLIRSLRFSNESSFFSRSCNFLKSFDSNWSFRLFEDESKDWRLFEDECETKSWRLKRGVCECEVWLELIWCWDRELNEEERREWYRVSSWWCCLSIFFASRWSSIRWISSAWARWISIIRWVFVFNWRVARASTTTVTTTTMNLSRRLREGIFSKW
jgi:hypothetical protein